MKVSNAGYVSPVFTVVMASSFDIIEKPFCSFINPMKICTKCYSSTLLGEL